ncbi:MAG: 5-oxoprolinase subunit PxpB [Desulfobulbus sp.]|nr:5-oxoprolinase subunit PxpB [Desulfobulbus sp.]
MQIRLSGDRMLIVELGDGIDPALNDRVQSLAVLIRAAEHPAVEAVVPSYRTLALYYDPERITWKELTDLLFSCERRATTKKRPDSRVVEIPVCYGGAFGPDLGTVAACAGLGMEEVIRLHCTPLYRIYALGFAPGFCYLGGLDPRIHTPRLTAPRVLVPAGSVGIAGAQTGVYPLPSPGGWQLIGRTPLQLFVPDRSPPVPYRPGDTIRFLPISAEEFARLSTEQGR